MKRIYILLLLFCVTAGLMSVPQFNFKKYQVEGGLSHNTVWCILQDSYGFMWFGTSDGLNRFDGRNFVIYKNELNNDNSLGNNSIQSLFEDEEHNLWVGTINGIYIYDRETDRFLFFDKKTKYGVSISSEVKKIIKTEKGTIWIGTLGQGVFIYDPQAGQLTQNSLLSSFVWDICEDKSHRIYISSPQDGLICMDQNGKFIEAYPSSLSEKEKEKFSRISCISSINNQIWFSLGSNKLGLLDNRNKQIKYYDDSALDIGIIRSIEQFSEREILIGSDNGLYTFDIVKESFVRIDNLIDPRSLSDQTVNAIAKDAEGGFWIATYLGGVNYLARQSQIFEYYYPVNTGLKGGKVVNQFCEDGDRNIWIGTQDGLRVLDARANEIRMHHSSDKIKTYDIRSLLLDEDNIWIGTLGDGLKVLNLKTDKTKEYYHIRNEANTLSSNDVFAIFKDSRGDIFIGTSWGLCRYNQATDNFKTLSYAGTMISVSDIAEDDSGNLWVTTNSHGIFRIRVDNNDSYTNFKYNPSASNSIPSNSIICAFKDSHGNMWFGSNGNGLFYYEKDADQFLSFSDQSTMLHNKVVYSIEEDNLGFFWVSTNAGLIYINPANKGFSKLFTKEDGLQGNQFNFNSSLKSSSGKIYFGGINGFNSFYPEEFQDNDYIPAVYITDIRLNNGNKIKDRDSNKVLPVYLKKEISLPFGQNSLSFQFAALSYEKPYRNEYMYLLEGFDKDWIDNGNSDIATYTNLPPGKYTFKVMGSNNDNRWNENGTAIQIQILPPWWRSMYAYFVYAILILSVLFLLYRYWTRRTEKKLRLQMEEYELKKEKEVYQSKIDFFINLVHEIRTPLTLINLPLEKLSDISQNNPRASRYLSIIDKNINYLLGIVSQLLDFQKIENKKQGLDIQEYDLNILISDIYKQFANICELKKIDLSLSLPSGQTLAFVDKDVITKVVFNLLGNAIKYAGTKIEIRLQVIDQMFRISVADDGAGVSDNEKGKIFEPFYQISGNNNSGTGIGLAFSKQLSESHNGTLSVKDNEWGGATFVLSIPLMDTLPDVGLKNVESIRTDQEKQRLDSVPDNYNSSRILVVEDNEELLLLMNESLSENFTVYTSVNGEEALKILENENIDLIVSDVMMPVMDGFELTKTVKSNLNYSHIPVILLTAKVANEFYLEGLEYGADVYLGKPFPMKLLIKQIENLLKLKYSFHKMLSGGLPAENIPDLKISKKDNEFLEKLYLEIDKHLAEYEFSIDNLAETMFMSRSNFYRKIKGLTGMSPNDFLKTIRLNKAAELLLNGDHRVKEVYEQVGFNSSSYFAKCFKSQFGVLPKDYINKKGML